MAEKLDDYVMMAAMEMSMATVEALFLYWYNTDPEEIVEAVYDNPIGAYKDEKVAAYQSGLVAFWGELDWEHRTRMVAAAMTKYLAEATRKYISWKKEEL